MKEYKYKAFISYRHLEPDMQAAEKLQKLLENYKPPKNLAAKKENWRIFRDVSELQSSSDLSEDIRNAIEDSEFLIVICSPAYNESKWCMQELTRFRELHNDTNENIITLLVSGEPDKAFPELLRFRDVRSVDENGKEMVVGTPPGGFQPDVLRNTALHSLLEYTNLSIILPQLYESYKDEKDFTVDHYK